MAKHVARKTKRNTRQDFAQPKGLRVEQWSIERLVEYAGNPRENDNAVDRMCETIKEFGFRIPIVAKSDGLIVDGHLRYKAARKLGLESVPVALADGLTDVQIRAFRIAANQSANWASWSPELLRLEVSELKLAGFDMPLLGFDSFQLTQIMTPPAIDEPEPEIIPEPPKNPVTKNGDIWTLGRHRIMCGDCREPHDVDTLMDGSTINLGFTSPPYAEQRDYDKTSAFRPIPPDEYVDWFKSVAENVAQHLAAYGSWFVNIKPSADGLDTDLYVFDLVLAHVRQWGWHFATEYCWERNGVPKSVTRRFKNQFEPVYQFARGEWKMRPRSVMHQSDNVPIPGGPGVGQTSRKSAQGGNGAMFGMQKKNRSRTHAEGPTTASKLQGIPGAYSADIKRKRGPAMDKNQGSDMQKGGMPLGIPREEIAEGMAYPGNRLPTFISTHEATGHAAAFPVGLPAFFIKAYSDESDAVYDPFLGSGSTLIAAEQNNRIGYGMEISPAYVDVCVERWQRITGKKAKLIRAKGKGGSLRHRPVNSVEDNQTIR